MNEVDLKYEKKYENILKDKVLELFKNTSAKIFLFGSRARGEYLRGSDFDIGVESVDSKIFQQLKIQFEDFHEESIVPYKVDLVLFDSVNPNFKKEAKKDAIIWKAD
ncbi:MAG: nucleotidyltransferase domain-containing protein [Thermodesulfobacteriota bacterium]|nr:nucleotidyltransferase domain-containing protein [Thermodesulfobacteriota bacterium]